MNNKLMNLETWMKLSILERTEKLANGWELTELSRSILNMCIDLIDCGAYISNDVMLKYYKKRRGDNEILCI